MFARTFPRHDQGGRDAMTQAQLAQGNAPLLAVRDISVVFFFDPELNCYFEIPYRDTSRPPLTLWELREVRRRLTENGERQRAFRHGHFGRQSDPPDKIGDMVAKGRSKTGKEFR